MKALKHNKLLPLAFVSILGLAGCGGSTVEASYERADEDEVYQEVFGEFASAYAGVSSITNENERFVKYAAAEAALLDSGGFVPTTTQGGAYTISRIAPRTVPYVFFGNDNDKVKTMVLTSGEGSFIKPADRETLIAAWEVARAGGAPYDPAAILSGLGYSIGDEYSTTTSAAPSTLDMLATSQQVDTEQMVNCIEGLIQYNNLGVMVGACASAWEANADNTVFTFTIRDGMKWYTSDKTEYAAVTADDFVAGFQHMLDAGAGLEYLVQGVVKGVNEYLSGEATFDKVGCYVNSSGQLVFELEHSESYFLTRLAYSCFSPLNRAFFLSKGGAFGVEEFKTASAEQTYSYGTSMADQVYNSAFIPTSWDLSDSGGSIILEKNSSYWDASNVSISKAKWVYDDGSNPSALYSATVSGQYPGIGLTEASGTLALAKADGNFAKAYVSDTTATTFLGSINLCRGAFSLEDGSVASSKSEEEKILTAKAVRNIHFRKALLYGWDRATWNGVSRGEDLKSANLRNMYTQPDFVSLSANVTVDGETFTQGTSYGELVQHFADKLELGITVADGQDGWYNLEKAQEQIALAREEISTEDWPEGEKVKLDLVYMSSNSTITASAQSYKQLIESALGDYVEVNLVEATTTAQYYYSGYYANSGAEINQDVFYNSGWGPDYGDPSTYLDTFTDGGFMTIICGLL